MVNFIHVLTLPKSLNGIGIGSLCLLAILKWKEVVCARGPCRWVISLIEIRCPFRVEALIEFICDRDVGQLAMMGGCTVVTIMGLARLPASRSMRQIVGVSQWGVGRAEFERGIAKRGG
jgi:hypothetical protein